MIGAICVRFTRFRWSRLLPGKAEGDGPCGPSPCLECERVGYFFGAVIIGKSSVRKGEAGSPFLFQRFTNGKSLQP